MVRYTILRFLIFFGVVIALYLVGLKDNPLLLIALAAVISAIVSLLVLRGMRDEMTAKLIDRHEARLEAKANRAKSRDELDEDAEADRAARQGHEEPEQQY